MKYSVIIVAAGSGTRMGLGYNKVYADLADGRAILAHSMEVFENDPDCTQLVIATDASLYAKKITGFWPGNIVIAKGGETRQESVYNALLAVKEEIVFVHDGARPYLSQHDLMKLKDAMRTEQAALLCVPCKDTIKQIKDGYVIQTYERSTLASAQTPQAFRTELLLTCMNKAFKEGYAGTDDCSLVERYADVPIKVVEGSYSNLKITTPEDLSR